MCKFFLLYIVYVCTKVYWEIQAIFISEMASFDKMAPFQYLLSPPSSLESSAFSNSLCVSQTLSRLFVSCSCSRSLLSSLFSLTTHDIYPVSSLAVAWYCISCAKGKTSLLDFSIFYFLFFEFKSEIGGMMGWIGDGGCECLWIFLLWICVLWLCMCLNRLVKFFFFFGSL